jgi:23S rRNA (adenine2503-C2)-methyltransferase
MEISHLPEILALEPKYRAKQIQQALFIDLVASWQAATILPQKLRTTLQANCPIDIKAEIVVAKDKKTIKALLTLADEKLVETVLMKHQAGRNTVCISCMVGCPMRCAFCATGEMGLVRNLSADEMIEQILFFARYLKPQGARINSVVFMGMGEPFLNYDNVIQAIRLIQSPNGLNVGARHISVSTCGILNGIKKLAQEKLPINLAISLHAPTDEVRQQLMPIAKTYPIKKLLTEVDYYITQTNRKVMFEYLMIKGVNDSVKHAQALAALMKNRLCVVNLIQYNPTNKFIPSPYKQMNYFKSILEKEGVNTTMRYKFGQDIKGACGQLATKKN